VKGPLTTFLCALWM